VLSDAWTGAAVSAQSANALQPVRGVKCFGTLYCDDGWGVRTVSPEENPYGTYYLGNSRSQLGDDLPLVEIPGSALVGFNASQVALDSGESDTLTVHGDAVYMWGGEAANLFEGVTVPMQTVQRVNTTQLGVSDWFTQVRTLGVIGVSDDYAALGVGLSASGALWTWGDCIFFACADNDSTSHVVPMPTKLPYQPSLATKVCAAQTGGSPGADQAGLGRARHRGQRVRLGVRRPGRLRRGRDRRLGVVRGVARRDGGGGVRRAAGVERLRPGAACRAGSTCRSSP